MRNQARSCPIDLDKLGWVDGASRTVAESGEYVARICHIDGLIFELGLPEEPLWLRVDSLAVVQAVGNVVHNAIKYASSVVAVVLACRDGQVEIRVEDDGQGMAGLDVNSLLNRYTRGGRGLDEARSGSGLGLAIANAIMVEHGGDIVVGESASGGARVRLRFPETLRVSSPSS
ncbi:MAG: ATP-binding protein, partial [Polyangiaceae bacterium]